MTSKACTRCKIEKPLNEFPNRQNVRDGKQSRCKVCLNHTSIVYKFTLIGCLRTLLKSAKSNAKKRFNKGRIDAGVFDLTFENIECLWNSQDGKCYYSNIPMKYDQHEWRVSLERLNPEMGYIKENVVLTCIEFNSTNTQWSNQKVVEMLKLLQQTHSYNEINFNFIKKLRTKPNKAIIKTIVDDVEYYNCNHCDKTKRRDMFYTDVTKGCKECNSCYNRKHIESPRGALQLLIHHTKTSTQHREKKNTNHRANSGDNNIDFEFLVEVYKNQKGLCAYSGIPLRFQCQQNWKISLERKDVSKGYTRDNVCLICLEFNTSDKSLIYKYNNFGSSAWSKEKFALFVEKASEKYFH